MNEKKKMYLVVGVIIVILILVISIIVTTNIKNNKLLNDIEIKMKLEEPQIFYFTRPTCHYCILLKPITDKFRENYGITYNEINTDQLSNSMLQKILTKFGTDVAAFGTPYLVITKNGKVIGEQNGYSDENVLFELFKKNGLIPENESLLFKYIDFKTLKEKWNQSKQTLIMIGQTGEKTFTARNNMEKIIKENNLEVFYMDLSETDTSENYQELLEMIGKNDINEVTLFIVENGKLISQTEEISTDMYQNFLKTNGVI